MYIIMPPWENLDGDYSISLILRGRYFIGTIKYLIFRECPMTSSERYSTFKGESQSSSPPM